jgi:hypothetical protein
MVHRIQQVINLIVAVCLLGSTVWIAPAGAGMIGTDKVATESQSNNDRDRLKTLVARPEIAKQLETLGVPPDKAQERINAMTDSECARSPEGSMRCPRAVHSPTGSG